MKILSSHFAATCDKYDSPAPNGSFARRCEAARSAEKNSITAKIFKYALTAALFLLATAFLIGAAAGYWIIVSRSDVPTSGICSYDSTNLLRYYLADESSDQFGKALDGDLGSASATYDGKPHFPIVSKTPIKKFDGYDKALLPLQFADFNSGGDLTQAYFDDFGYEYVLLSGFNAGAKISPENIKTSAEILKNQNNYAWITGVPTNAGVYAVRITSLKEVTVVGSSATRSKYGSYIVIYTIAPATATITEAAPLSGSFITENTSSAQSAETMAADNIEGGDGTFIYGVDESGQPLNQGVKVTSLDLGGSSHSVSGYSDNSVGSVKSGLNIVLSDNVKSAANHSEAGNENFWYTVTASLSGAEAGNYALSNATSLRFRIAPVELNAADIKWYYDGAEVTNGKTVVYNGNEHGLTAKIDETKVSNKYYAKYGNDESVKSAVKSLIDAINGGSAPLTLGVYARSNGNYTAAIPSTSKVAKNAGIYLFSADVYLGGERSTDVYLTAEAINTLKITAAQITVNYGSDLVYNGKEQKPTFALVGLVGNESMGVTAKVTQGATEVTPINVGSYTLTLSVSGETYLNYVFGEPTLTIETSTSHNYKITPKPVDITVTNVRNITYDGNVHAPAATYTDVNGTEVDAVNSITKDGTVINATDVKNAGAYTLTASLVDKTNYVWSDDKTIDDKTYNWTISKAKATLTTSNVSNITYGGEVHAPTATYTDVSGATVNAVIAIAKDGSNINANDVKNAGAYTLTASLKDDTNYVWADTTTTDDKTYNWTISKLKITVKVTNSKQSATYNGTEPTINTDTTVTLTDNGDSAPSFVSNELSFSVTKETGANVGTYALTPTVEAKSGYSVYNYDITCPTGTFTIKTAALTVTANSENITYGDDRPTFSVSYDGFVNNETQSVLEGSVVFACDYVRYGNAGSYSITPSGLKSDNYAITFNNGTLTVNKKQITATISLSSYSIYVTDYVLSVAIPSVTFSGLVNGDSLTVTYTATGSETTDPTTLYEDTQLEKGVYTINAVFSGDKAANYEITVTTATLTVKENDGAVTKVTAPEVKSGLVYNATEQVGITHNQANYADYYTVSGTASATNAGNYSVTVTLKDKTSCVWADDTTDDKTYNWTISTATVALTTSNVSNITYDGVVHAPTATYTDVSGATVNAVIAITKDESTINANDVKNAGAYTLTASLKDKTNYVWSDNTTDDRTYNWTISKANITITPTVTSHTFTYGTEIPESTVSYNIEGTNYNNELIISIVLKDSGSGKICELPSVLDVGTYNVSVTVSSDNISNYNVVKGEVNFKVAPLEIKFSGIININYTDTDKTLNATLLKKGLVKSSDNSSIENLSMPSFASAVARTYDSSNDDSKADNGEHGYYKVELNSAFTVGSTYKVTAVLNSGNYAFAVGGNTIIVKYKTAKIGTAYYTIEDALSASGDITLAGDSSGSASYIITSFTKLTHRELTAGYTQVDIDNYFKNYKDCSSTNESINHYTLSSKSTLLLPYDSNKTAIYETTTSDSSSGIFSVLIIPEQITLTVESGSTLNVGGVVYSPPGGNREQAITTKRSVIMNLGIIDVYGTLNCYGYIKNNGKTGLVKLRDKSTATDILRIFDFKGGSVTKGFHEKKVFPLAAYTIHNISCETEIYKGATYKAFSGVTTGSSSFNDVTATIIGDNNALFKITTGYIRKSAANSLSKPNETELTTITGSNQTEGQLDEILICGTCEDTQFKINVTVSISTSPDYPIPIGFMSITISDGAVLTLSKSSYKFLPGSRLTVKRNGKLKIDGISLTMYSYNNLLNDDNSYYEGANVKFSSVCCKDKNDALLLISGEFESTSSASVSGKMMSDETGAKITINGSTSTSVNVPIKTTGSSFLATTTCSISTYYAKGNVLSAADSSIERNLASGTYYSIQLSDGTFAWYSTSANIEFDSRGGSAVSSISKTVGNGGYTITESDVASEPTKDYYKFDGWYIDSECTTEAKGQTIFCSTTLYAKWFPTPYTITFEARYEGCETSGSFNPGQGSFDTKNGCYCMQLDYESEHTLLDASDGDLVFLGWYTDEACTKTIQVISKYTVTGNMTLYARFLPAGTKVYTIEYDLGDNAPNGLSLPATTVLNTQAGSYKPHDYANDYNNNAEKSYYFLGWYTDTNRTKPYSSLGDLIDPEGNDTIFTLYAKWDKKLELILEFPSISGFPLSGEQQTGKYYYYGDELTISADAYKNQLGSTLIYLGLDEISGCTISNTFANDRSVTSSIITVKDNASELKAKIDIRQKIIINLSLKNGATFSGTIKFKNGKHTIEDTGDYDAYTDVILNVVSYSDSAVQATIKIGEENQENLSKKEYKLTGDTTITISNDTGGSCVAAGTLITLWDGSKKKVEDITVDDFLLVFNHETGRYDFAKVLFNDIEPSRDITTINLRFSNGTCIKVIYEHGFFDLNLNKYVYINELNFSSYIGHTFYYATWDGTNYVKSSTILENAYIAHSTEKAYSPVTDYHLNYFTEDMLSMPGGISGLFNIFEYDNDLKYDKEKMEADIEKYGLFTYEDFKDLVAYEVYVSFPAQYFKIAIAKGILTEENLLYYIERYAPFFDT